MRTKITSKAASQQVLMRMLDALAQELIEASDEEVLEAAKELGMDLNMRWSAAFAGVMYPAAEHFQLSDFFDPEALKRPASIAGRSQALKERPVMSRGRSHRSGRSRQSAERKPPNGK